MNDNGHGRTAARLDELQVTLEKAGNYDEDALWYRVRYTQAVACLGEGSKGEAREAAVDLCGRLLDRLDNLNDWFKRGRTVAELRDFLNSVAPRSLVVLASALLEEVGGETPESALNQHSPPTVGSGTAISRLRQSVKEFLKSLLDTQRRDDLAARVFPSVDKRILKKQLLKFAEDPCDPKVSAEFHRLITPTAIVDYVLEKYGVLDFYTAYNLACYYARKDAWRDVKHYLHSALELGAEKVRDQALGDPALKAYLADKGNRAEFDKLAKAVIDDPESSTAGAVPPHDPEAAGRIAGSR
jgi:hypothetical protein